jgi:hypothetical protein
MGSLALKVRDRLEGIIELSTVAGRFLVIVKHSLSSYFSITVQEAWYF